VEHGYLALEKVVAFQYCLTSASGPVGRTHPLGIAEEVVGENTADGFEALALVHREIAVAD
jgi:hypothetical protein